MIGGDGVRIAAGLAGMGLMVVGLVVALNRFERYWQEFAAAPIDEREPCSDYDGD